MEVGEHLQVRKSVDLSTRNYSSLQCFPAVQNNEAINQQTEKMLPPWVLCQTNIHVQPGFDISFGWLFVW